MRHIHIATRIALGLCFLLIGAFTSASIFGLFPRSDSNSAQERTRWCETLSEQASTAIARNDTAALRDLFAAQLSRRNDLLSIAFRSIDNQTTFELQSPNASGLLKATGTVQAELTLFRHRTAWGKVIFTFQLLGQGGWWGILSSDVVKFSTFVVASFLLAAMFFLRRTLQQLDPNAVVPERVKTMLDTLAEGVLVLDPQGRIVVANESFSHASGLEAARLIGRKAADLPWVTPDSDLRPVEFPWIEATATKTVQRDIPILLKCKTGGNRFFNVSASPIGGDDKSVRGTLVTCNDLTAIQTKNTELVNTLHKLEESHDTVRKQNETLALMAMRDALTGCHNRRSLFDQLSICWANSIRYGQALSVIMVDVDHFKKVNDTHGHAVGDQVLQTVAKTLLSTARTGDIVARYGGEEFCVLLPQTNIANALIAAEKFRAAIAATAIGQVKVTASFGISSIETKAGSPEILLDQADKALYVAKKSGRNRSVRFDQLAANAPTANDTRVVPTPSAIDESDRVAIPFPAVAALLSALEQRDVSTAAHSQRVAKLAVRMARPLMTARDLFVLEIAGLLHDIGKIGVPDSVLLKPGRLTAEEFRIMDRHNLIGVEIINSAFKSPELTYIVRYHHAWYGGNPRDNGLPVGNEIPLRSRILSICDSYDAMTTDRPYRVALQRDQAVEELRRCAGTQFDPILVDRFIESLNESSDDTQAPDNQESNGHWIRLSVEVERIASVLAARDVQSLSAMSHRLMQNAQKMEMTQVAEMAHRLHEATTLDQDASRLLNLTNELLELCRSAQSAIVPQTVKGNATTIRP